MSFQSAVRVIHLRAASCGVRPSNHAEILPFQPSSLIPAANPRHVLDRASCRRSQASVRAIISPRITMLYVGQLGKYGLQTGNQGERLLIRIPEPGGSGRGRAFDANAINLETVVEERFWKKQRIHS